MEKDEIWRRRRKITKIEILGSGNLVEITLTRTNKRGNYVIWARTKHVGGDQSTFCPFYGEFCDCGEVVRDSYCSTSVWWIELRKFNLYMETNNYFLPIRKENIPEYLKYIDEEESSNLSKSEEGSTD